MDPAVSPFRPHGDPDAIAARAVALLAAGDVGEGDLTHIREWVAANPRHRLAFESARRAWVAAKQIIPAAGVVAGSTRQHTIARARALTPRRVALGTAVLLAAYLAIVALIPREGLLHTAPGQIQRIQLPDGTIAWLDGNSAIRLEMTDDLRHVELVRGRVSFAVKRDPHRPFEVEAAGTRARDIGTEFSLNHTDHGVTLAVREGIVQVEGQGKAVTVRAGEATHWTSATPPAQPTAANADSNESWREGQLVFDHARLADALDEIARHRRGSFWLIDSDLGQRRVSGVVFASRIEEGLDTLAAGANAKLVSLPFVTLVFGD